MEITKKFIEKELLSPLGRLKRKKLKELNISEEIVYIKYNNVEKPRCKNCKNEIKFQGFSKGFSTFCSSKCSGLYSKNNSKYSIYKNVRKEGITKEFIKEKVLDQGFYNFCSPKCVQRNEEVKKKINDTLEEKYGTRDPLEIKDGRKRGNAIISSKEFIEKQMEKNLKEYGYKTSFGKKEIQDKVKNTFIKNYGVSNPMFSKDFLKNNFIPALKEKRVSTYLERFGEMHPMKNKQVLEKMKNTNLEKYGVPFVSSNKMIKSKIRKINEQNGNWITEEQVKNFRDYTKLVWRYTNQNDLTVLENFDKRAHTKEGYHLDHKYSIFQGFKDNIPAKVIGGINNLEMLQSGQNLSKNRKCSISKDEILSYI